MKHPYSKSKISGVSKPSGRTDQSKYAFKETLSDLKIKENGKPWISTGKRKLETGKKNRFFHRDRKFVKITKLLMKIH